MEYLYVILITLLEPHSPSPQLIIVLYTCAPSGAILSLIIEFEIILLSPTFSASNRIPPPSIVAELLEIVQLIISGLEL